MDQDEVLSRPADPVGDAIEVLAEYLRADRWLIALDTGRGWVTHQREASHKDDLLVHLAEAMATSEGPYLYDTPELGHAGLRLGTGGVERLFVLVCPSTDRPVVVFFENPAPDVAAELLESDLAPTLAKMGASIRGTYDSVARVGELRALGGWLPVLRRLADGEIDEGAALAALGSLGVGKTFVALRPERDNLDAAWADRNGTDWSTGATRLRNAGTLKLDPPTSEQMSTIAKLLGLPTTRRWLFGRGQWGTTVAIGDAVEGMESADAVASLYEASAGRGRDTTAARNNAMLTERARIAGVIHEGITQVLTNVAIQMEVLDQVMEDPEAARKMVRAMRTAVLEALDSLRGAILELTPNAPEWTDLAGGLERFIGDFGAQWGLELTYDVEGTPRDVDPDILALVFAFVQEGVGNIRKHAGTEVATISLTFQEDSVVVTVEDEGKGFDPAGQADEGFRLHQGLQIIRSRVRLAGGKLDIQSTPGKGTRMLLEVVA
jgi:signal transduction histidine kinase